MHRLARLLERDHESCSLSICGMWSGDLYPDTSSRVLCSLFSSAHSAAHYSKAVIVFISLLQMRMFTTHLHSSSSLCPSLSSHLHYSSFFRLGEGAFYCLYISISLGCFLVETVTNRLNSLFSTAFCMGRIRYLVVFFFLDSHIGLYVMYEGCPSRLTLG